MPSSVTVTSAISSSGTVAVEYHQPSNTTTTLTTAAAGTNMRSARTCLEWRRAAVKASARLAGAVMRSRVGEDIAVTPAQQIKFGACGKKTEGSFGQFATLFAVEHHIKLVFERVQMQHIGCRIGLLCFG